MRCGIERKYLFVAIVLDSLILLGSNFGVAEGR